jgi:myo-inositol-1(or 4)-monophosphatase
MDYEAITKQVCEICRETGSWIQDESLKFSKADVESKGRHNFVTYVDKGSEERLVNALRPLVEGVDILAEEGEYQSNGSRFKWIIDPLDGTTNFIHGIPLYSISVALTEDDGLVSGVVFDVSSKECFSAYAGGPARMGDIPITVSGARKLEDSLLATGFPYILASKFDDYLSLFKDLVYSSRGIRRLGSAALDLAYVACGRFDGFYEYSLSPWDVAAGALIVKQAGGSVTDFKGGTDYLYGKQIIASNGNLQNEMIEIINRYFN